MLWIKNQTSSSASSKEPVPLKHVHVDVHLHSFAADVKLTQLFRNNESTPIEAVYCFPVEENAAIYSFIARIDDEREIVAELKEKKTAQQEYTQALAQGHGAYLFEQDEASNDIFIVNIGALQAGSECRIIISYVSELDLLHSSTKPTIRFTLPTTIAPRYSPEQRGIASPGGTEANYAESVPYTMNFVCHVAKLDQHVACVSSPSHPIKIDMSNAESFVVTFSQQDMQLDRDLLLDIELSESRKNTIAAVEEGAAMASFIPTAQDCEQSFKSEKAEFIFVIDCSGSMANENKIGLARKAMLLFVKSLPVGCHFNIIRFGSKFSSLFSNQVTREYQEETMHQAESLIKSMQADLGGTELLETLHWLQKSKPSKGCVRQVFLLTDGEVSNVNAVIDVCRQMADYTRIFSFGLGYSPSRALVKGLARATKGYFTFIAPNTSVDIHVAEQLTRALHPSIGGLSIRWKSSQRVLHSVPEEIPAVFIGDRLLFYALLDESMPFDHTTTVELDAENVTSVVRIDHIPTVLSPHTVRRLAAKALLRDLLHASKTVEKQRVVDISLKYGILCPYTAFIGVERRLNATEDSNTNMKLREVPIMLGPASKSSTSMRSLSQLQADIDSITSVMKSNTHLCLERGEAMDDLVCRSKSLAFDTKVFYANSVSLRQSRVNLGAIVKPVTNFFSSLLTRHAAKSSPHHQQQQQQHQEQQTNHRWSSDVQTLVEYFIEQQRYDGLWMLSDDDIRELTGKTLNYFSSSTLDSVQKGDHEVLISTALVIAILELRCGSKKALWQTLSNKAQKRLVDLFGGDGTRAEQLMKDIHDQLPL